MKAVKKVFVAATMAAFLIGASAGFTKAATKEDITYLIESAKKTESIRKFPKKMFEIKALYDEERIGDKETQLFFNIYCYPDDKEEAAVPGLFVTVNYITFNGNDLDVKHTVIWDGREHHSMPDGKPDEIGEVRLFEKEELFTYVHENGDEEVVKLRTVEDWFPTEKYDLDKYPEKERINKIFDNAIELFKLKTKGGLLDSEKTRYRRLKEEIGGLVMESEYFKKSRKDLEQEFYSQN